MRAAVDEILATLDPLEQDVVRTLMDGGEMMGIAAELDLDQATIDAAFVSARHKLRSHLNSKRVDTLP